MPRPVPHACLLSAPLQPSREAEQGAHRVGPGGMEGVAVAVGVSCHSPFMAVSGQAPDLWLYASDSTFAFQAGSRVRAPPPPAGLGWQLKAWPVFRNRRSVDGADALFWFDYLGPLQNHLERETVSKWQSKNNKVGKNVWLTQLL